MRITLAVLSAVATLLMASEAVSNEAHRLLQQRSMAEQAKFLGTSVNAAGHACRPSGSTFKGMDQDDNAYYTVFCDNGQTYMVQVKPDAGGSTRVLSCDIVRLTGGDCLAEW